MKVGYSERRSRRAECELPDRYSNVCVTGVYWVLGRLVDTRHQRGRSDLWRRTAQDSSRTAVGIRVCGDCPNTSAVCAVASSVVACAWHPRPDEGQGPEAVFVQANNRLWSASNARKGCEDALAVGGAKSASWAQTARAVGKWSFSKPDVKRGFCERIPWNSRHRSCGVGRGGSRSKNSFAARHHIQSARVEERLVCLIRRLAHFYAAASPRSSLSVLGFALWVTSQECIPLLCEAILERTASLSMWKSPC